MGWREEDGFDGMDGMRWECVFRMNVRALQSRRERCVCMYVQDQARVLMRC